MSRPRVILNEVIVSSDGVTSFSSGNLPPLFTASVATESTTPALTFAQVAQDANVIFAGPSTGSSTNPTFRSLVREDLPITGTPDGTKFLRDDLTWQTVSGGVSSVSGTTNRITSTGGATPVIDISASYAGQSSIVTVGTLTGGATGAGFTVALGTATITGDLAFSNLTQGTARSILGVTGNSTADFASIQGTTDQILRVDSAGTALTFGSIDLSKSAAVGTSILPIANGGTGSATQNWWGLSGTSTLAADVTIAMAGFNTGFLNGNILSGPTGATITASTRLDTRGVSAGLIQRWANSANTVRGGFQDDGIFYIGTAIITSATEVFQIGTTTSGTHSFARFANKSAANSTTAGQIVFENDGAGIASIIRGSSAYTALGGNNSFNFGTGGSAPVALFTNNQLRYSISGTGLHVFTNNATTGTNSDFTFTQNARTAGIPNIITVTGGAHTGLTASEFVDVNFNLSATAQFTGNTGFATLRTARLQARTYAFASATGTITTASTLAISGPPIAGTNAAITNPYSLNVESGVSNFGGNVRLTQTVTTETVISDTTVTVVINGTTYKLLARA